MEVRYAGFWARFVAYVIDSILLAVIQTFVFIVLALFIGVAVPFVNEPETSGHYVKFVMQTEYETYDMLGFAFWSLLGSVNVITTWLYFALLQSSPKQATLGKAAMGMIVVDENFERLTFLKATVRYFSKYVSGMLLYFGYIMAAFSRYKRALHDIIAGTYVIYDR